MRLPLYPYQEKAVEKFLDRGNLLCSMEMGTGKTPTAIACAEKLIESGTISIILIVCPASLRFQWLEQIWKFTKPKSDVIVVPGGPRAARIRAFNEISSSTEYVIVSYETVVSDPRYIRRINADLVILDEASNIKSFKAKRTKKVKQILRAPYRIALTGTPAENRPDELYSIMQWVDDSILGRWDLFDKTYIVRDHWGSVVRYKNLPVLHNRLSPAQYRIKRTDPDVKQYLPAEDYDLWFCDMDKETSEAYKVMAADMLDELDRLIKSGKFDIQAWYAGEDSKEKFGMLGAIHLGMEMLLDHPDLIVISAQKYCAKNGGSRYCHQKWQEDLVDNVLHSPKLKFLKEKVDGILDFAPENKIIIFTKYKEMVEIIGDFLDRPYLVYHGNMSSKEKNESIKEFAQKDGPRIFISTHAGAYGTDMHMANYLIKYDIPYSFGRDSQISGRHVRVSSEFDKVYVRDIVMRDTIEERNLARIKFKREMAESIVDNRQLNDKGSIENETEKLRDHLTRCLSTAKMS